MARSKYVLIGFGLAALALASKARAEARMNQASDYPGLTPGDVARMDRAAEAADIAAAPEADVSIIEAPNNSGYPGAEIFDITQFDGVSPVNNSAAVLSESPDLNLAALLYAIRSAEHIFPDSVANDAAYNIFYGGSKFSDMSDHPVLTGEKIGVKLDPAMCRAAGYRSGVCVSTGAGAYQINVPTWREFRKAGPWGDYLGDFSPGSQDEAARRILIRIGALELLNRGDFIGAVKLASKRWASLPWSTAQQHPRTVEFVIARFNEAVAAA